ncbi:MAG: hypothetical protein IPO93_05995 [Actinobacteria bacterium]|jgi:hypothetical protein|nr:hypothetical protein [Actinomycetota bacterium]
MSPSHEPDDPAERPDPGEPRTEGGDEPLSPEAQGMAIGAVINDLNARDPDDAHRTRDEAESWAQMRWLKVLALLLALVILGGAALAAGMLVINRDSTPSGTGAGAAPPPAAPPAGTVAGAGAPADVGAPGRGGDCAVDPADVTVDTVTTTSTRDSHGTNTRGETTITNIGDVPVNVAWFVSHSTGHDNSGTELTDEGWYGGPILLGPGESRTELVGVRVLDSGDRTWTLITGLAAFADSPDCFNEVSAQGDQTLELLARPVPNPFPAGPS